MKDCYVVFDTNAYRKFTPQKSTDEAKRKILKLINLEKQNNIKVLLATDVAVELYSHLKDLNDCEYERCKNSVITQFMHCMDNNNPQYILGSDVHLCNIVFEKMPEFSINEQYKILRMSGYLYNNYSHDNLIGYTKNFNEISKFSLQKKEEYVNKLRNMFEPTNKLYDKNNLLSFEETKKLEESLTDLRKELRTEVSINKIADGLLTRAAGTLDIELKCLNEETKKEKINIIKTQFLVPILFYRNILKSILDSKGDYNFSDSKKGNSYWDYELTFQIGNSIGSEKLIFVTDEKKIHTAACEARLQDRVIKLDQYLKELNFNQ